MNIACDWKTRGHFSHHEKSQVDLGKGVVLVRSSYILVFRVQDGNTQREKKRKKIHLIMICKEVISDQTKKDVFL